MIVFEDVVKRFADETIGVNGLSLKAPKGKLTALVGPSGCGKTTSLRMINRLVVPTSGTIFIDGEPTQNMDVVKLRRSIGYVIQNAGLFPHLTVLENVATTARLNGVSKTKALGSAKELLQRVGLADEIAGRYPSQLSGGQQQRVGVARALASDPELMLMDEPFSAVDPVVRTQLQDEFLRLQRQLGKTIIMVTHDIDEALKLADQIAVLRPGGTLAQVATPRRLLAEPADKYVAEFVGRDRGYRFLGFAGTAEAVRLEAEPTVRPGADAQEAKAAALGRWVLALDEHNRPLGWADLNLPSKRILPVELNLSGTVAAQGDPLRVLLDAVLSSPSGRGVVVDADGRLLGTATLASVSAVLEEGRSRNWAEVH
ncbi:ABC transporter ATP-binding protein [Agrobacterium larrymoorei]|uniref:ATP-binding cassette domain-containing protein n=1 Tax=Agrobacterium larrymoorei TaxID=160699 RepID=A0A4D7E189_9HYPH|nr:ATP-binding cassette domain-containing protein [Agrobacterium larrymoorei]QCJ01050.1 ATP-binding cassette domain-containing protein [Agrobacterium larrymoorei]QYA10387.1 ATP-binding cassette domain-containing protein [Agrobacterium larrymoorei]